MPESCSKYCKAKMRFKKRLTLLVGLSLIYYFFFYDSSSQSTSQRKEIFETNAKEYAGERALAYEIDTSDGRRVFNLHLLPENRDDAVDVVICSDTQTLGGMIVAVNSVIKNTQSPVFFHLVTISQEIDHIVDWLTLYHPFIIMEVIPFDDDISARLKIRGNTRKELASSLNFARFWMPRLFPHLHGRVVYLDDDVLVLGDIREMRDHNLEDGHVIAASADNRNTMENFFNFQSETVKALGIRPDEQAFNAGVFMCDIDQWRTQRITEALVYWMERNTQEEIYGGGIAGGASQPPMLIALHGKVTKLDPSWHVRHFGWWMGNKYPDDILQTAKLMHWNGRFKPWKSGKASKFAPIWHMYYQPDPWGVFKVVPPDAPAQQPN